MSEMTKPAFRKKFAAYFLATTICLSLGYWAAHEQAKIPSGYLASYNVLAYFIFGGIIILVSFIIGIVSLLSPKGRWFAPAFLLVCALLPASYLGSLKTLSFLGQVRYEREDRMIPIGSDMPKGLVILFKKQTSAEQIEQFNLEVLNKPHPEGKGHYLADGLCLFTRPPSIQGYEDVEVRFCKSATEEQQAQLKAKVLSSPLVYKVFDDIRPSEVKSVE